MKTGGSEISDEEFRRRVMEARAMTPAQRMEKGLALREEELERRRESIKAQHPNVSHEERKAILSQQLEKERHEDDEGIYFPVPMKETQS